MALYVAYRIAAAVASGSNRARRGCLLSEGRGCVYPSAEKLKHFERWMNKSGLDALYVSNNKIWFSAHFQCRSAIFAWITEKVIILKNAIINVCVPSPSAVHWKLVLWITIVAVIRRAYVLRYETVVWRNVPILMAFISLGPCLFVCLHSRVSINIAQWARWKKTTMFFFHILDCINVELNVCFCKPLENIFDPFWMLICFILMSLEINFGGSGYKYKTRLLSELYP